MTTISVKESVRLASSFYAASSAWPSSDRPAQRPQWHPAPLGPSSSCRQRPVGDAPPDRGINEAGQPIQRVPLDFPIVQTERELVDVAAQVLLAGMVIDAVQAALHHGPHAFNAVRADAFADVFALLVVNGLMRVEGAMQTIVSHVLVGMERSAGGNMGMNGIFQVGGTIVLNGLGDGAAPALPHPNDGGFIMQSMSDQRLAVRVLILFLASNVRFVYFHDAAQDSEIVAARFPQSLEHKPRRLLRDADFLGQLQRRDTLARGHQQVHRVQPLMQRHMRPLEDRPRAHREIQLAGVAAVEAALAGRNPLALGAGRTRRALGPQPRFQVRPGRVLIGKHRKELKRADRDLVHSQSPLLLNILAETSKGVKYIIPAKGGE